MDLPMTPSIQEPPMKKLYVGLMLLSLLIAGLGYSEPPPAA
ncbi:MAG: hypothetical protein ACM3KE_06345 [Hyphomicrobiales bacterium]